jgi:Ni2+-binding GTPase involved in maturation of urease and hydrogenase
MMTSVTEGEDKPLKYPLMFRACELVLVNKSDLLPYLDYDLDKFLYHLDAVNPGVARLLISARTGEGMEEWRQWLLESTSAGRIVNAAPDETNRTTVGSAGIKTIEGLDNHP